MSSVSGIVLCAGQGTRMKSDLSKMLHPVAGVPLCCWPIGRVRSVVSGSVVAVVGYQGDDVQHVVQERFGSQVCFAVQSEQRGTGDAVKVALAATPMETSTVLVVCGDTPLLKEETLRALLEMKTATQAKVVFCVAHQEVPTGYGRIMRDSTRSVLSIVEEVDATPQQREIQEINAGIYAFDAAFLREHIIAVDNDNAKKEIYLTDLIERARHLDGEGGVATLEIASEEMLGINDRVQLSEAEAMMRRRLAQHWMKQGVTMIDPATTYIDAEVELDSDVTIYPNVILRGHTRIEKGVTIHAGCVLDNSVVEEHSQILSHCVLENAVVGRQAKVGPFARLRPGSVLEDDTRVGNFVELKKAHLKRGAKASHLAYLGDVEIGENCNIGAGTITCNYDGFRKHHTKIGDGSFIGSNSTLVAPLAIGELAYVGAGSTITQDVPDGALAISRARQDNKLDYAARLRERLKEGKV